MILFTVYGYLQPYKTRGSNYLNIVIMMSFMTLLMLRASPYLQDNINVVQLASSGTTLTSIPCTSDDVVVTPFSVLLATVYYIPLVIATVCLVVWTVHSV